MVNADNKLQLIIKSNAKIFNTSRCKIAIDKRLELLSIITTLTNYRDDFCMATGFDDIVKRDYEKEILNIRIAPKIKEAA